jgi:hypothetical protein
MRSFYSSRAQAINSEHTQHRTRQLTEPRPKGAFALETCLITFACYGCHIHGDESGTVDREHNAFGGRLIETDPKRALAERQRMDQPPYSMDRQRREAVLAAIVERCSDRHWNLRAAHVRTNHVHIVVDADVRPERIMNDLKSYASPQLNQMRFDDSARKRWARHGSTRWLWKPDNV